MKRLRMFHAVLWGIALLAIVGGDLRAWYLHRAAQPGEKQIVAAVPDGATAQKRSEPFTYYRVAGPDGHLAGVVFVTSDVPPQMEGFNGPVRLLVGLLPDGSVASASVLHHRETPGYFAMVKRGGVTADLTGRSVTTDPESLDAVSGATITSRAIQRQVLAGGATVARKILGLKIPETKTSATTGHSLPLWEIGALLLALAAGGLSAFVRDKRLRAASLALGFIVVGLYLNVSLTFGQLAGLLQLSPPTLANIPLILVMIFALGFAVSGRRTYCRHVCPFGAAQQGLYRLTPWKLRVTPRLQRYAGELRWVILVAALCFLMPGFFGEAGELEPFAHLFGGDAALSLWVYAGVVLGISAVVPRFWCRMLCPTGAVLELAARLRYTVRGTTTAPARLEPDDEPL